MKTSPYNKNRLGMTRAEMERQYPHPPDHERDPSPELYDHIHWIRADWKNKKKCAICGEKVSKLNGISNTREI